MISIDRIRIQGFRGIDFLQMALSPTCVLIGQNNSGKTSVLRAMQMALSDSLPISHDDFHHVNNDDETHRFSIDLRIVATDQFGNRLDHFSEKWAAVFGKHIAKDRQQRDFFAFRTHATWLDDSKRSTKVRTSLSHWDQTEIGPEITTELDAIEYVPIDAHGDLRLDLANDSSFLNRALETLHQAQHECCEANDPLFSELLTVINRLLDTLQGPGSRIPEHVELSTHKIGSFFERVKADASKIVESKFQAKGTQKTLVILSLITVSEMLMQLYRMKALPLHLVIGAEEPETHLHPNAQRSLINQLKTMSNQLIVTTHSPYITSVAEPNEFRALELKNNRVQVRWLPQRMEDIDIRAIKRLIMRLRGEVLFARGLIFVEGLTEEQLVRGMFQAYFGHDPSELGINIIGVDGKSYAAFLMLALSLRKPFCIISDNDGDSQHVVKKQIQEVEEKARYTLKDNRSEAFFLSAGNAMEGELAQMTPIRRELVDTLIACTIRPGSPDDYVNARREQLMQLSNQEIKRRLQKKKAEYSGFLADIIVTNPYQQPLSSLLPSTVLDAFKLIEGWLKKPN
ncbi:MAG: AAA family ATPase [Burkholderiaceae bacterium]|nr:AAA family ATPase [Burkholderiaceae bacterium]